VPGPKEIQAGSLCYLLDEIERGETIIITPSWPRHCPPDPRRQFRRGGRIEAVEWLKALRALRCPRCPSLNSDPCAMRGTNMLARVSKASHFTLLVSKQSRFAFSVKEPSSIGSSSINAMRHARPPSLRYGAPSSCCQHSRTTWPRRRSCGVGLTAGKAGRFTYSAA
jgi:hypothetical protein